MSDNPPVVLVHGLGSSSEHGWRGAGWIDMLQEAGREVLLVDLPGHGTSRRDTDPESYADAAAEIAEAFARRGPVDAVGFSAGAHLLLESAVRGLASFNRLALIGLGPRMLEFRPEQGRAFTPDASDGTDVLARVIKGLARRAGNDTDAVLAFARRPTAPLTAAGLATVACEVLVVIGERDTAGSPDEFAALFPKATGRTIDGADHYSVQAHPRAMSAVFDFLGV
ncbi:Lysophospholipase, alpha-beta hydrolase superfamily [Parafrankia irregularis]|uniref:Lysophospholipase, alpha-beta hydrolase superfamily n=1 Tax=Parafrankia irregularis TaxID=795642 RepID=A0A0S4QQ29_9ACTN|nr:MULTISPECIES: alpha/beta fold hydrolase [Parafrankia]MBE3206224.1 alpha/beta hydrolase [Parafrankia sp. CH37]CUU57555.1 Lysophospholipase, alpha-beta hydrolase superfamily [Parafrankia irregularis]